MKDKIIIYHGSKNIIEKPTIYGGKPTNDYGYGFYCTEQKELANEWACSDNGDGYANEYLLDLDGLNVLDLTSKKYTILNWIALLLKYRIPNGMSENEEIVRKYILDNFLLDLEGVDVIKGYRADDSYFSFARDFIRNTISLKQLSKAMELGKLGIQIVLKSQKAYDQLKYINSSIAENEVYYTKRVARDFQARKEYRNTTRNIILDNNDLFVMDIIRQGVKNDDSRIQRNVSK
ncbi:MAG: DUF3990 domain-containing protein [Erysipelotrichaceae bacterium]|nr:DUF3990 domain-containing protein [Erysipelotrichaceae bacterium]